ncbi:ADP-heptose:LPS heptosyltransferase [Bradyrhizobium sp. GM22.5]
MRFPAHVRSLVGKLSLRETASVLAAAGAVVANDSGLGHVAAAVGAPTVLLFGPTPHEVLGGFPRNVIVMRAGLLCEPCWHSSRFAACSQRIDCLAGIAIDRVATLVGEYLPG